MSEKKYMALTFDDGPSDTTSLKVLEKLKKYNAKGSFFLIGGNITPEREYIVREEIAYGCDIENHSLTHSDMRTLDKETIDKYCHDCKLVVTAEEGFISGGLGAAVAEEIVQSGKCIPPMQIIGLTEFPHAGSYKYMLDQTGLDAAHIAVRIKEALKA